MRGWDASMRWPETGLDWIAPSPALTSADAAIVYPATVFLEATSLSYGRGTDRPFTLFGAPWLDAQHVVEELRKLFRFEGYRLIGDALVAISSHGDFTQPFFGVEGVENGLSDPYLVQGTAEFDGRGPVRLHGIRLLGKGPILETSVNAAIGQTLVMGASKTIDGKTLILTVRAETN